MTRKLMCEHPDDQELNRLRGDFAVKGAQFSSEIAKAEEAQDAGDFGKALFAYLEAQKLYPASFFVEEGIQQSVEAILNGRVVPTLPDETVKEGV